MIGDVLLVAAALAAGSPASPPSSPETAASAGAAVPGPPTTVSLEDVFRILRDRTPRTAAERARVGIAGAETVAARVLPNPSLDFSSTHLTSGTNTGAADVRQIVAGQPLLLFGQRRERRRSADLQVQVAESEVAADYAERALAARQEFAKLLVGQERARVLDDERADLDRVAKVVAGRATAGDRSRYDALRIDLELHQREAELSAARADVEEASGSLAATLGLPGWRPTAEGSLEPAGLIATDEEALWNQAQNNEPALVAARRDQEAARQEIEVARHERLPVPVLSAGGEFTQDAESTSFVAGLSLALPILDRGQGPIARATARSGAADLELAARTAETRARLHGAVAILAQRRDTLERLDRDVMGRLPEVRQMSEEAYHEGQTDILDLLDALRSRAAARLARLDALEALIQVENEVLALIGRADSTVTAGNPAP